MVSGIRVHSDRVNFRVIPYFLKIDLVLYTYAIAVKVYFELFLILMLGLYMPHCYGNLFYVLKFYCVSSKSLSIAVNFVINNLYASNKKFITNMLYFTHILMYL